MPEQVTKQEEAKPKRATNREFTEHSNFVAACVAAGVEPTKRQASKFRRKRGLAYVGVSR